MHLVCMRSDRPGWPRESVGTCVLIRQEQGVGSMHLVCMRSDRPGWPRKSVGTGRTPSSSVHIHLRVKEYKSGEGKAELDEVPWHLHAKACNPYVEMYQNLRQRRN